MSPFFVLSYHIKFLINWTSFKRSPVLKDHFFVVPNSDPLIQVWLYVGLNYQKRRDNIFTFNKIEVLKPLIASIRDKETWIQWFITMIDRITSHNNCFDNRFQNVSFETCFLTISTINRPCSIVFSHTYRRMSK
jgi:hypothetical protein